MAEDPEVIVGVSAEMEETAAQRASDRARTAKWDLNTAIFLFAVLILIIILVTYTRAGIEIVAPVAIFGLVMVWLAGWRRGRQLYQSFYNEEIARLSSELEATVTRVAKETEEETIEERVQRALRERWR